ncbi:MAG: hypothetical protein N4A74_00630 [Carboxylicivirga sp.]|jgi:hypothetical protein|nr:hypothetical protein [Carboxylicivirga sp.]
MKNFLSIAIMLIVTGTYTFAQNDGEGVRTIFDSGKDQSHGGYGAIMVNYSQVMDRDALLVGGRGAWIINHNLGLGLGGYGLMTDPKHDNILNHEYSLLGGYGGLLIEPIVGAKSPVHLSFPILIGAGGVAYTKHWQEYENGHDYEEYEDSDAFFVLEPGVELEFNMLKFFRLGLSVSYRYTSDIKLDYRNNLSTSSLSRSIGEKDMLHGFNYGVVLKFGKF